VFTDRAERARAIGVFGSVSGLALGLGPILGGASFTTAERGVWWLILGLGTAIVLLALLSTSRWATATASRAAALFRELD
jgi:hypothetical protein